MLTRRRDWRPQEVVTPNLTRALKWIKDNWEEVLGALGLGGYVAAAWKHVVECGQQPCALWIGIPAFLVGGGIMWAMSRRLNSKRPLLSIQTDRRSCRWSFGARANAPTMGVNGEWFVTNREPRGAITLIDAQLKNVRPVAFFVFGGWKKRTVDFAILAREGAAVIPAGRLVKIMALGWIEPPFLKHRQDMKATVVFLDHAGYRHKVRGVVFEGPMAPPPEVPPPPAPVQPPDPAAG